MPDNLPREIAAVAKSSAENNIIKPHFQKTKQMVNGIAPSNNRLMIIALKLFFQNTISPFGFLFFSELGSISSQASTSAELDTMHAWYIISFHHRALRTIATLAL